MHPQVKGLSAHLRQNREGCQLQTKDRIRYRDSYLLDPFVVPPHCKIQFLNYMKCLLEEMLHFWCKVQHRHKKCYTFVYDFVIEKSVTFEDGGLESLKRRGR